MKKQTTQKKTSSTKSINGKKRNLKIAALSVLGIFIIAQVAFDVSVLWRHFTSLPQSEPAVATTIFKSIDGMYSPLPVEAKTGTLYASAARLTLPADNSKDILYYYSPADGTDLAVITFTTRQMIDTGESSAVNAYFTTYAKNSFTFDREGKALLAFFEEVPSLQACARGVQVYEAAQPDEDGFIAQGTKRLQDGRTLYFYTEKQCKQQAQLSSLLDVVKRVESF